MHQSWILQVLVRPVIGTNNSSINCIFLSQHLNLAMKNWRDAIITYISDHTEHNQSCLSNICEKLICIPTCSKRKQLQNKLPVLDHFLCQVYKLAKKVKNWGKYFIFITIAYQSEDRQCLHQYFPAYRWVLQFQAHGDSCNVQRYYKVAGVTL